MNLLANLFAKKMPGQYALMNQYYTLNGRFELSVFDTAIVHYWKDLYSPALAIQINE
jgi:hypothetical protein